MQAGRLVLWHRGSTEKLWRQKKYVPIRFRGGVHPLRDLKVGGWPDEVLSVTDQPFNEHTFVPRALTFGDIQKLKDEWERAVSRALAAGVDVSSPIMTAVLRHIFDRC